MAIKRRYVAGVLVCALFAAACGDDDAADGNGADVENSADTSGATLTVAAAGIVNSVDPERYEGHVSIDVLPNIAGTLLRFEEPSTDATTLQQPNELVGELAESFEVSDDGTVATFVLRDDVVSSAGEPLDAQDVEWSLNRMLNTEGVPIGRTMAGIGGWDMENAVEVVDDRTVRLHFAEPNAVSLSVLSTYWFMIQDRETIEASAGADDPLGYEWLATHSAGFGPYMVDQIDPGRELRLKANPNYHLGQPEFTEVIVRAVSDGASRLQLVQTGEVNIATQLAFDQVTSLQGDSAIELAQPLYASMDLFVTNVAVEPFDDPRVRRAISFAIDRDAILAGAYQGLGTASTDFFHDVFGVTSPDNALAYDPDQARSLLAEAGVGDGFDMTIAYNVATVGAHIEQVAVLLQSQLADVGINVELQNIAAAADFDAAKRDGSLMAWLQTANPLVPDPGYAVQVTFETGGLNNQSGYSSPTVDELSTEVLETPPGDERIAVIDELNTFMIEDMPALPIADTPKFYAFNGVTGFLPYPQGSILYADLTAS